jgi:predicted metalloprotease
MRTTGRRSTNIDDRRGLGGRRGLAGGSLGGIVLILIVSWVFGINTMSLLDSQQASLPTDSGAPYQPSAAEQQYAELVSVVLADTEDTWRELFAEQGARYVDPSLVMFTGGVQSGCGNAPSAMGPFYCPLDQKVYLDLAFFDDLHRRHQAPGDFAQAYVIAHEVGHHVQNLVGTSDKVQNARQRAAAAEANALSVMLELQADCYAGVWGHHANRSRHILEAGDVDEALNAASAIGDDRLQREATGRVSPESFTHGTSAQRVHWFRTGLASGNLEDCDTFGAG